MKLPDVAAQGKSDEKFLSHREGWRDLSKCFAFDIAHDDQEIPFPLHHATYARNCYSPLGGNELTASTSREPIASSSTFTDSFPHCSGSQFTHAILWV
ncbi:hypothetical protein PISMIDRAFT_638328 [Pisolithus microcarpus 441]|uniref:Uncharacterized protein n=1 Tax=Pisolithus microcarpus 441 TaxID=765257 RepID=A0A0C9Z7D2_9AGAM|nr:hypothetical protein PISMIDRAFT_638328 [Pisolithus microcarpus 441]